MGRRIVFREKSLIPPIIFYLCSRIPKNLTRYDMNRYCIIMAGGVGTRFWPLSRQNKPKQFLDIMGTGKSFLRHTFERFAPLVPRRQFHRGDQPPLQGAHRRHPPRGADEQILCEPIGRNTAPAIAYAAYWLQQRDPEAQMIVTPADHWVVDEPVFRTIIGECLGFVAEHDALMTVGIRPTRPKRATVTSRSRPTPRCVR